MVTTAVAFTDGGYFPSTWGWSALALLWVAAVALLLRNNFGLERRELAMLASLGAFVGWAALSSWWSMSVERSLLEVQRDLVYLGGLLVVVLLARGRAIGELLLAVCTVALLTSAFGLATFFFRDRFEPRDQSFVRIEGFVRLSEPLGYPNAIGLVAAIGALVAIGFAAHGRSHFQRACSAACLVVFVVTLFFTFSRGAWISLALGLVVMLVLDPGRGAVVRVMATVAPIAGVAVWLGSRADALTSLRATRAEAAHQGHLVALATVLLAAAAALATVGVAIVARRVALGRGPATVAAAAATVALVAAPAAVIAHGSTPAFHRLYSGPLPQARQRDLALTSLSARVPLWRQAWHDWERHKELGSGAGTFEQYWLQHRATSANARDAHSLYLETLAEVGPIGLALLLTMLVIPLLTLRTVRLHRLLPSAFAGFVAYVVCAAGDWMWEMPAVTLLGLFCGSALVLATRSARPRALPPSIRAVGVFAILALASVALAGLVGNGALNASGRAASAGEFRRSTSDARKAITWLPWSGEAWWRLALAQSDEGHVAAARESLRKAIAKTPNEWRPWISLVHLTTGHQQRLALRSAARLNPRELEIVQFLLAPGSLTQAWRYRDSWAGWPVAPLHRQHAIRSGFLDPRPGTLRAGGEAAYHSGIDITVRDDQPEPGAPPGRTHRAYAVEGGTATISERGPRAPCVDRKVSIGHFDYWHVDAEGVVTPGEFVRPGQMIGWTCKGLWHVHLAERMELYGRRVYVNPVHPGMKLRPYVDHAAPRIRALGFYEPAMPRWTATVGAILPRAGVPFPHTRPGRALVFGRVDVRASVDDPEPSLSRAGEPASLASPTTPYRLAIQVVRESDDRIVLRRTVFRADVFLGDSRGTLSVPIRYHYAPGTTQAVPAAVCLRAQPAHCGGKYWFRLFARPTAAYWDTRRTANGNYRVRVRACDAAGNCAARAAPITIRNGR